MYFVCVDGQPQSFNGHVLVFCEDNVRLFPTYEVAEGAAKSTLRIAKERGYDGWAIVIHGYQIFKVVAEQIKRQGTPIMTEDMTKKPITQKYVEVTKLRESEAVLGLSEFQRGQLAGAQQALAWIGMGCLEPVRAILTDAQIKMSDENRREKHEDDRCG